MRTLEVKLVESPETHPTGEVLGITEERFEIIQKVMFEAINSSTSPLEAVEKMSKSASSTNELAFMCMSTQSFFEKHSNPLERLFGAIAVSMRKGGE